MVEVRIGVSGWSYAHWRGAFYPEGLRALIAERCHVPAIQWVVGSHKSSTSLSDRERETQIMMVLFAAFSVSLSTESR